MEIFEWSTLQKYIGPLALLSVTADWKSSNTNACTKQLSLILANKIDNGGGGLSQNLCKALQFGRDTKELDISHYVGFISKVAQEQRLRKLKTTWKVLRLSGDIAGDKVKRQTKCIFLMTESSTFLILVWKRESLALFT